MVMTGGLTAPPGRRPCRSRHARRGAERRQLGRAQRPRVSFGKLAELQRSDGDANEVSHVEADRREEPPHLALAALGHHDFDDRVRSGSFRRERSRRTVLELDTGGQLLELRCEMARSRVATYRLVTP